MSRLERTTPARVSERQALQVEARLERFVVNDEMGDVRDVLPSIRLSSKVKVVRLVPIRTRGKCVTSRHAIIWLFEDTRGQPRAIRSRWQK